VLLEESLQGLAIRPDGRYLDATFGRGGHSRAILAQLGSSGRLLALDKDPQAVAEGQSLAVQEPRFAMRHGSFADLAQLLQGQGWSGLDGVLMDLGVSSPQLDQAERGFSFLRDGTLDMRMDPTRGQSAAQWLAGVTQKELTQVLREFGEERHAGRIATAILAARQQGPIERTGQLAEIIKQAHPAWEKGRHPATKSFQGIRIFLNNELGDLERGLEQALEALNSGGRLAVISFHSLEDRRVKRFIRDQARGDHLPPGLPVTEDQLNRRLRALGGAIHPSEAEIQANPRARSAVLRLAERL
jgi:16S rRNA (cytosine1402-N4)-methyltransferase